MRRDCGIFKDAVRAILAVIANQERVPLSERTTAGLKRARRQGRVGGRPRVIADREKIRRRHAGGQSYAAIATQMGSAKTTIRRIVAQA